MPSAPSTPSFRLDELARELRKHHDPARVKARKQREARKLAYLTAAGLIPPKPTRAALDAAWRLYQAAKRTHTSHAEIERVVSAQPEFDDDIPF